MRSVLRVVALLLLLTGLAVHPASAATWTGSVSDAGSGALLDGARIELWASGFPGPQMIGSTTTDAAGSFTLSADIVVSTSHYFSVSRSGYVSLFNQRATDVDPQAAHFRLDRLARLDVLVRAEESGAPLTTAIANAGPYSRSVDGLGQAVFELPPGDHSICATTYPSTRLHTCIGSLRPGWPDDVGTPLTLAPGEQASVVIDLRRGGQISGRITSSPSGRAVPSFGYSMRFFDVEGTVLGVRTTSVDANGQYVMPVVPAGEFRIQLLPSTQPALYHAGQLFAGIACGAGCAGSSGTPVTVATSVTTSGIDFVLPSQASISGRISSTADGSGVAGADVSMWREAGFIVPWQRLRVARSDADGAYHLDLLQPGLGLRIGADRAPGHHGKSWPSGACCTAGQTIVPTDGEQLTGYDLALEPGTSIAGRILARGSQRPLAAEVEVRTANFSSTVWHDFAGPDGRYRTPALPAGDYRVYATTSWPISDIAYEGSCTAYPAEPCYPGNLGGRVTVSPTAGVGDIDIALATPDVFADSFE